MNPEISCHNLVCKTEVVTGKFLPAAVTTEHPGARNAEWCRVPPTRFAFYKSHSRSRHTHTMGGFLLLAVERQEMNVQ